MVNALNAMPSVKGIELIDSKFEAVSAPPRPSLIRDTNDEFVAATRKTSERVSDEKNRGGTKKWVDTARLAS